LRQKEVINIKDGCRFGYICDLSIDENCGEIINVIVPGPGRLFGLFGHDQEYIIPWSKICQIGDDIILVDVETKKALVDCEC
jgi:YlmC/YmxH family sporulation protein